MAPDTDATSDPDELEQKARRVLLEVASELRRLDGQLADLAEEIPDPATVPVYGLGAEPKSELASVVGETPPTVLEAQLGAVEIARERLHEAIAALSEAAEISAAELTRIWRRERARKRQRDAAGLSQVWRQIRRDRK